ncbi:dTDP-4-dehydrorhamnose 3,5-epimerase [Rhodanobacter sp. AS-Z3]|uniref:dTDP-4-dehydrorhamnose 3,5-epimerase n=1 Tax=Rhodanobacter sp. AS-Z3 TaxID=3031330 RepID=UPI00247A11B9|nr:dTDP-4-dehydrorhamnose 3,5-epimerase [Rhodanobacter sp. AS-Z3]WEN14956.1 dTDP-4-dehydrorhamnose 3,5-epimerase [Rhodanobacter sp. AS-Z3]
MRVISTSLPSVLILEPQVFGDSRGFFYESYNERTFCGAGIADHRFVQTNVSRSAKGVLRGLHYQWPNPQRKLVNVLEGEVYDVAVDIRHGSPTFGQSVGVILTADNHRHFWIPEGFAHGFCVLSEFATFTYQCTALYDPKADAGIRWNDAALGIDWPISAPLLSDKDGKTPLLQDVPAERLPVYTP